MTRTAIQLHTIRNLDESLPETIERVAALGFEGVEFANRFHDTDPDAVRAALDEHGIEAVGSHVGLEDLRRDLDAHLDRCDAVDCRRVVIPHLPAAHFRVDGRVRALADVLNELGATLDDRDFELVYHNTSNDFLPLPGTSPATRLLSAVHPRPLTPNGRVGSTRPVSLLAGAMDALFERLYHRRTRHGSFDETAFHRLCELTDPESVAFEVDIGSVAAAGHPPTEVIDHLGDRTPLIHMADVTVNRRAPWTDHTPVNPGDGIVDFDAAATAARRNGAEWLIFEHDHPTNPTETLQQGAAALNDSAGNR